MKRTRSGEPVDPRTMDKLLRRRRSVLPPRVPESQAPQAKAPAVAVVETIATLRPYAVRIPKALELIGVKRTKLYDMIKRGEIKKIKDGGTVLIPLSSIEAYFRRKDDGSS